MYTVYRMQLLEITIFELSLLLKMQPACEWTILNFGPKEMDSGACYMDNLHIGIYGFLW